MKVEVHDRTGHEIPALGFSARNSTNCVGRQFEGVNGLLRPDFEVLQVNNLGL